MVHPFLIAALITVLAHHIQNPAAEDPSPAEVGIYHQLLGDLDIMVSAGDNPDLEKKRNLCRCLLSAFEMRFSTNTIGRVSAIVTVAS
jgi:hypothetical protein